MLSRLPLARSMSSKHSRRCTLNEKKSLAATTRESPFASDASRTKPSTSVNSACAAAFMSSGASSGSAMSSSTSLSLSLPSVPPVRVLAVPYLLLKCVNKRLRALIILANSPAIVDVECPLKTASLCLYAANVDSCTRTSAPMAWGAMPTESHVSPSRHRRRPGRSGPNTRVHPLPSRTVGRVLLQSPSCIHQITHVRFVCFILSCVVLPLCILLRDKDQTLFVRY